MSTATGTGRDIGPRLTWVMRFESPATRGVRDFILYANEENFDRLGAVLAKTV